jgi:hypothetical protein
MNITNIEWNGSKRAGQQADDLPALESRLRCFALDPRFERYGNHMKVLGKGRVQFRGNFHAVAAPFSIVTTDGDVIRRLASLITANKRTESYQRARSALLGVPRSPRQHEDAKWTPFERLIGGLISRLWRRPSRLAALRPTA